MPDPKPITRQQQRSYEEVLSSISEIARNFLAERKLYGEMRTDIKRRSAEIRLYIVNGLTGRLKNDEVIEQIEKAIVQKNKLTLDSIDALIGMEIGDAFYRYEEAKFNAATSEKAFPMFQAELTGHQTKIKRDITEQDNVEYAQRMSAPVSRHQ